MSTIIMKPKPDAELTFSIDYTVKLNQVNNTV